MKRFLVFALVFSLPAFGHGIEVFAVAEGSLIRGTASFDDKKPLKNHAVAVWDTDGQPVAEVMTDELGKFTFQNTANQTVRFSVTTIDGHKASYTLIHSSHAPDFASELGNLGTSETDSNDLEKYLAHEFATIREDIHRLETTNRFHDVVGGIGYILGILGIIALIKSRKS